MHGAFSASNPNEVSAISARQTMSAHCEKQGDFRCERLLIAWQLAFPDPLSIP